MEDSPMDDVHAFDDLQIEPIVTRSSMENSTMDFHSIDDFQIEVMPHEPSMEENGGMNGIHSIDDLQIEPIGNGSSMMDPRMENFHSIEDLQVGDITPLQQIPGESMVSQASSDADLQAYDNIDLTETFTTDMVFHSRDELIQWTRDTGKTVGTVIVISKSDMGGPGRIPRINFACERSGKRRDNRTWSTKTSATRKKRTKRCECPFSLKGIKLPKDDQWKVEVVSGVHNHPMTQPFEGSSFAGRLTLEEKEIVVDMVKSGLKPKDVLHVLRERNLDKPLKLSTIYNARSHMKYVELSTKTQMQQLLKKLSEHEYVERHRSHEESESIRDLFWAHPESIKLAKCFPSVFFMDCTYKRNKYRPSLLEIVGVTSTNKTFSFAFVYVEAEKEDNYVWALDCMKSILNSEELPSIIVTDREVPLMKAINKIFPEARNFLCRHHISRDLATNCKNVFNTNEAWNAFLSRWNDLVFSSTEEEYYDRLSVFEGDFSEYPGVLAYVKETWLNELKECFIVAWTDQSMHFGNTATNKVDNDQARLRRHLGSSQGNFNTMWSAINSLLLLQQSEINASFRESLNTVMQDYTSTLFEELKGCVSAVAMDLMLAEVNRADYVDPDNSGCDCAIRRTHGLPCSHEISIYKRDSHPIPISRIHPHWKKLSNVLTMTPHHELYYRPEVQMFIKRFEEANENEKVELLKKLREILASVEDGEPTS